MPPKRAREIMEEYLGKIWALDPSDEEMNAFARAYENHSYGVVLAGDGRIDYRVPFIHETWRKKWMGSTHIDMGNSDWHLRLDRHYAPEFIDFIKQYREKEKANESRRSSPESSPAW